MNNASSRHVVPRLALLADGFASEDVTARVEEAVAAGVPWVHLRDHEASDAAFAQAARALAARLRARSERSERSERVLLTVNTHVDTAEALGAGLHLGARGPSVAQARRRLGPEALIGFSAHDEEEAQRAVEAGADYLFFSPVFPTGSKPGHPGAGVEALARVCAALPQTPVLALGGVTPERARRCLAAGAHGAAALSGLLHAEKPSHAAALYLQALSIE